jgi:hypothetical protein
MAIIKANAAKAEDHQRCPGAESKVKIWVLVTSGMQALSKS